MAIDEKLYKQIKDSLKVGGSKGVPFPKVPDMNIMGPPVPFPEVGNQLIPEFINGKPTGRMIEAPEGYWENIDPGFSAGWAGGDSTGVDTTATSVNKNNQPMFGLKQLLALINLLNPNKK